MKILVMSDSHSALSFMFRCIEAMDPDVVIHLGDHYDDGEAIAEEYPDVRLYQVPGNCDSFRCPPDEPHVKVITVDSIRLLMTHGHLHRVKQYIDLLLRDGRNANAQAVLYGHTHEADCYEEDGMWVLNPGSCGHNGGSVGLIVAENGSILSCSVLRQEDWEEKI